MALKKGEVDKLVRADGEKRGDALAAAAAGPTRKKTPPTVVVKVRWPEDDLAELQRLFNQMGLTTSAGIRMVCKEWMLQKARAAVTK